MNKVYISAALPINAQLELSIFAGGIWLKADWKQTDLPGCIHRFVCGSTPTGITDAVGKKTKDVQWRWGPVLTEK